MRPISNRPKIGLALSGGSGRAIAHIGVLEVLRENEIPIDYITACSSGTLIAASYACGTMENLKRDWLTMDPGSLWSLFKIDRTLKGVFSTEKAAEWFRRYTGDKKFEDVTPRLGFVCVDIISSEPVVLALGDLVKAAQASCTTPGLFEPVRWGNRFLVDGGLFSLVPVKEAKDMGADIVVGVDIAATKHIFTKNTLLFKRGFNALKKIPVFDIFNKIRSQFNRFYQNSMKVVFYNQSDFLGEELIDRSPHLFSILGKAMDIAAEQQKNNLDHLATCDIMLSPQVKHFGKIDLTNAEQMHREGRRVALEAVPEIRKLIQDFYWRKNHGA